MRERFMMLDGWITIGEHIPRGFVISASVPWARLSNRGANPL